MKTNNMLQSAAIVCTEVANDHKAILYGERSEPQDEADSGWQFLCGASSENWQAAKVWAVHEVLKHEPSLVHFIYLPAGTIVSRRSATDNWQIKAVGQKDYE